MEEDGVTAPNDDQVKKQAKSRIYAWVVGILLFFALVTLAFAFFTRPQATQDDSWAKVQAAGVLRVATSADYPPFSYTNQDFFIDGFDPALIRGIGDKLGV
ncbi:MAG: transporter substrate-binding domain-containing protein, partial [Anaerolineales bacterium]